jgi:hypothetical protein
MSTSLDLHELKWASASVSEMVVATNLLRYEKSWKDFLAYLERFWEKISRSGQSSLTTQISQVGQLRKSDQLLQYLMHARNSNEHTIRPILERVEGGIGGGTTITGGARGGTLVRGSITGGKPPDDLIWNGDLIFRFGHDRLEAIDVTDRGQKYAGPSLHMGQPITTRTPHDLAKMGFAFYVSRFQGFV